MSKNPFFRFKQFTVKQDLCAMKVCTDACVLGAWADVSAAESILDIGTGTGLLALMIAQRNLTARIDAVELDDGAVDQAVENVGQSPFANRVQVVKSAIQAYQPEVRYDCIVSNPPFFQSDLRSPKASKNIAHHAELLTFDDLLSAIGRLITPSGTFIILLPVDESRVFEEKAFALNWSAETKLTLYHHSGKKPFRTLTRFRRAELVENAPINVPLCIYEEDGRTYHSEFIRLMKDYYLIF
ncbi:methyltransferase [Dyadobacter sp. 32]|uniref:tRNA1(Val) (adenine(37)-N6)-methyltransferase n=1 Tax=Dyadobacter sp. 32 TaxID=538966 RepID=UPI0011EF23C3